MTVERAVELMQIEQECIRRSRACDRDCARCELVQDEAELLEAYQMAVAALLRSEWISCKDRLPEIGITVLTLSKWGQLGDRTLRRFMDGTLLFSPDGLKPGVDVPYWMPAPTLPKGA